MTPELEALARRAVACRGWRWMPGMRTTCGVCDLPGEGAAYLPDLTDLATLDRLLALVQEAWPAVVVRYDFGDERYNGLEYYTNEVAPHTFLVLRSPASLVAALEAAP